MGLCIQHQGDVRVAVNTKCKCKMVSGGTTHLNKEFNYEDELEKDSMMSTYGFIHQSIPEAYVEDMRGNKSYSLNMNHV